MLTHKHVPPLLFALVVGILFTPSVLLAAPPAGIVAAAEAGLQRFLPHIPENELFRFGFQDKTEPARVQLGEPFLIYTVHPDEIISCAEGERADLTLIPTTMWQFPVRCDGAVRTLLTVDRMDGKWEAVDLGGLAPANELAILAEQWPRSAGYELRYVKVFQSGSRFVAVVDDHETRLVPLEPTARALGLLGEHEPFDYRPREVT
ncbi:MAG: hypothetical protein ABIF77_07180, partial [bacterium]